jgi:riboflavin biosynthesis pyrimidine reductase
MEPGSLVTTDGVMLPPDPAERALRALYEQPAASVRVSMIRSADGKAAGPDGSSRSLNGEEDLRILRVARSWADVVLVGGETARGEEYGDIRLRTDLARARAGVLRSAAPDLAIVTRGGVVPDDLDPERTWLVTTHGSAAAELKDEWGDRVIIAGVDALDAELLVEKLNRRGLERVLCEGGPELATVLFEAEVVDDYCLTTSPKVGGEDAPLAPEVPAEFAIALSLAGGGFTMERWTRL